MYFCKFRHLLFINLRFRQILYLQLAALFYKNLRLAAGKFAHSTVSGNTYAPFLKIKESSQEKKFLFFEGEKLVNNDSIAERFLMFYALANFVENCQE